MLFRSHMQDLQEVTHDLHYENYRATRLADGSDSDGHGKCSICHLSSRLLKIELLVFFLCHTAQIAKVFLSKCSSACVEITKCTLKITR